MDSNPSKKESVACRLCGQDFSRYKVSLTSCCPECLEKDYSLECVNCGKPMAWSHRTPLLSFLQKNYCCCDCKLEFERRPSILYDIFNEMITNQDCQQEIHLNDLEEVILHNCAYFRLYQLYSYLEPYYDDGINMCDRLPHTQIYLNDILRRIKNVNNLIKNQ